jgi:hypothetical protein
MNKSPCGQLAKGRIRLPGSKKQRGAFFNEKMNQSVRYFLAFAGGT